MVKYCKTAKASFATTTVGGMGSTLNLDLCNGVSSVLERLRGVNPGSITTVTVEYNLMAELVFDQEWMDIMEAIGSLPFINSVSLSFRIPMPLPMQAFTRLIDEAISLETLNLVGLQLSETQVAPSKGLNNEAEASPVEAMIRAFEESLDLKNVLLGKYRHVKSAYTRDGVDPLLLALSHLPRCKVFHIDRTDVFSNACVRDLVFRAPFPTVKIGPQENTLKLEDHLPLLAVPIAENARLKELIILHLLPDETLAAFAELLQHNRSLEKVSMLRLEAPNFGNLLGAALAENTVLQILELNIALRDRALFRKNVGLLASSLGANSHSVLTTLKLDAKGSRTSCLITDPFLNVLRHKNFVLENLFFNRNTVPLSGEIAFYLKLNKIGRKYFLEDADDNIEPGVAGLASRRSSTFREDWVHMLIQNRKDVPVLHYFISRNPLILRQS